MKHRGMTSLRNAVLMFSATASFGANSSSFNRSFSVIVWWAWTIESLLLNSFAFTCSKFWCVHNNWFIWSQNSFHTFCVAGHYWTTVDSQVASCMSHYVIEFVIIRCNVPYASLSPLQRHILAFHLSKRISPHAANLLTMFANVLAKCFPGLL